MSIFFPVFDGLLLSSLSVDFIMTRKLVRKETKSSNTGSKLATEVKSSNDSKSSESSVPSVSSVF
jgi:hypothetical protein